jgi:hypothetical protein
MKLQTSNCKGKWTSFAPKRLRGFLSFILIFSGILLLSQISSVQEAQAQGAFGYRKAITVQSGQVSSGPHTDFPMLVSFTDADLKTVANGGHVASYDATNNDPRDIIFRALDSTTCNGTAPCTLDHEIEKYTATTGELVAWVRVPSINNGTAIYMYYGNSSIGSTTQNPSGVWNTYYKGVWHLKESGNGTASEFKDSTTNANHGRGGGGSSSATPTRTTGQFGYGQNFDGTNDYINISRNSTLEPSTAITFETWLNWDNHSSSAYGSVIHKSKDTDTDPYVSYSLEQNDTDQTLQGLVTIGGTLRTATAVSVSEDTWHRLVVTWSSGDRVRLYVDGSQASTSSASYSGSITY